MNKTVKRLDKRSYQVPLAALERFEVGDVITTSPDDYIGEWDPQDEE